MNSPTEENSFDMLIVDNYKAIIKRNPSYKYTEEEHRQWCLSLIAKKPNDVKEFIEGWTGAHNRGGVYHPV